MSAPAADAAAALEATVAQLQLASETDDLAGLLAVAREAISRNDAAGRTLRALEGLQTRFEQEALRHASLKGTPLLLSPFWERCATFVAAGGVDTLLAAIENFHCQSESGSMICFRCAQVFASIAPPPYEACVTAARLLLAAAPAGSTANDVSNLVTALSLTLHIAAAFDDTFRTEAIAAGAVEVLLEHRRGCNKPSCLRALRTLCGSADRPSDCTDRIVAANGLDFILSEMADVGSHPHGLVFMTACDLLYTLVVSVGQLSVLTREAINGRKAEVHKALLAAIVGLGRKYKSSGELFLILLRLWGVPVNDGEVSRLKCRCEPKTASTVVDLIVSEARLRAATQNLMDSSAFWGSAAYALTGFSGHCGGNDVAAPGTYALRSGALPLFQDALTKWGGVTFVDSVPDSEQLNLHLGAMRKLVDGLLNLDALADAAAAELLADEEAEQAARKAKSGKAAKKKASKTKGKVPAAAMSKPSADRAASDDTAVAQAGADAHATLTEAPTLEQPQGDSPVPELSAAAADAGAAPAPPLAPPPLPAWLLEVMQRPPLPPPPAQPQPQQAPRSVASFAAVAARSPAAAAPASATPRGFVAAPNAEVPRELECAICLDAAVQGRTACCGQAAFCASCAAALTGDCPLCRAPAGSAAAAACQ